MVHSDDEHDKSQISGQPCCRTVYTFLLVVNAAMFFICATTLAWGGWQIAFRRVSEAISACCTCDWCYLRCNFISDRFWWSSCIFIIGQIPKHVQHDDILKDKTGFLNKTFFTVWTVLLLCFGRYWVER